MGQGVLDIVNDVGLELDACISPTTPLMFEDRRQQERALKANRDWRVRELKAVNTIKNNFDDETCHRYDDIKRSSAFLVMLRE